MAKNRKADEGRAVAEGTYIDDKDRALNPVGRFFRHNAMHNGTTPMIVDEFERCAKCVMLDFWKPNA